MAYKGWRCDRLEEAVQPLTIEVQTGVTPSDKSSRMQTFWPKDALLSESASTPSSGTLSACSREDRGSKREANEPIKVIMPMGRLEGVRAPLSLSASQSPSRRRFDRMDGVNLRFPCALKDV
jgi:hypothetical protein